MKSLRNAAGSSDREVRVDTHARGVSEQGDIFNVRERDDLCAKQKKKMIKSIEII